MRASQLLAIMIGVVSLLMISLVPVALWAEALWGDGGVLLALVLSPLAVVIGLIHLHLAYDIFENGA